MFLPRLGAKSADNVVTALAQSRNVPFERVLFALGIRFVGATVAKRLARAFGNIDALMSATLQQLTAVDEIGERIAASVIAYFEKPSNMELVGRLREAGLKFELDEEVVQNRTDILAGKSIVISGVFKYHSRDEYKDMIERNGGKNVAGISKSTSFVLAGDNMGPSKLEKANKLNISIISEDDFLSILADSTN